MAGRRRRPLRRPFKKSTPVASAATPESLRTMIAAENCQLERRDEDTILVRVPSTGSYGAELPDAVFTFRPGDPQYRFWQSELSKREESPQS
jgi:hypothetical protein